MIWTLTPGACAMCAVSTSCPSMRHRSAPRAARITARFPTWTIRWGVLLAALADAGFAHDTVVLLLADHGDMLGERGLWYKMSFFEPACRIPLIVHAPGRFAAGRVAESASLVDILPTLSDMAGGGAENLLTPLDGHSLMPQLTGASGRDEVIGEYLAEGAIAPLVMIKRGRYKFVHSPVDPDQLYDLHADPDELRNLAPLARHSAQVREFSRRGGAALGHGRAARRGGRQPAAAGTASTAALRKGRYTSWDHQPLRDASRPVCAQ